MAKVTDILKNLFFILLLLQIAPMVLNNLKKTVLGFLEPRTPVGYLEIKGTLWRSNHYVKQLHKLFKNDGVKAILLKFECPGGASGTAQQISNELEILKKEYPKPTVALVENVCASGGYYIACVCDHIVAPPSAWVGSIGASIPYLFKVKQLIDYHLVAHHPIDAGKYKSTTNPFVPLTAEQEAMLHSLTDDTLKQFVQDVARHRNLSPTESAAWADGKIFTGNQAKALGLIDEIGSRSTAVAWLKQAAQIEGEIAWVKPEKRSTFQQLFGAEEENSEGMMSSMVHSTIDSVCSHLEERYGACTTF